MEVPYPVRDSEFVYVPPDVVENVYPVKGPTVTAEPLRFEPVNVKLGVVIDAEPIHTFPKEASVVAENTP